MAAVKEELPTKELRELTRRLKRGYKLERTSAGHFRVRNRQDELVQWKGKNLTLNRNAKNLDAMEEALQGSGALSGTKKPQRLTPEQQERRQRGIEAMRETQRKAIARRRQASLELRKRMQPWLKQIGSETPGVIWDLARYLHKTNNGVFASQESAQHAIRNVLEGQGVKDESVEALARLSERFEADPEPLALYIDIAREARGIEATPSTGKEWPFMMKLVDVEACFPDFEYQRPAPERFAREIVLHFDERKVGSIQVSEREDGRFAILDGQTRWRAVRVVGKNRIWASVYEGMTLADEARFFYEVNHDRKSIHPYYGFRARVLSGEAKAVEINKIVEDAGLRVAPNTDWARGGIAAVRALEEAYDQPSEIREDPLTPTTERLGRWKGMKNSTAAELIRGFGRFYAAYSDEEIDEAHFGDLLGELGPSVVLARARDEAERAGRKKQGSSSSGLSLAKALVSIHNGGLARNQRLDVQRLGYE